MIFENNLPRIVCIVGPTSSGKSALALHAAKLFQGEIINADARQLYKGCTIGTGAPTERSKEDVPHHLYGVFEPTDTVTVADWKRLAIEKVQEITGRGNLPILVGGTGLYIQALIDNHLLPEVPPHPELRRSLEGKSLDALLVELERVDPSALEVIDTQNRRRVIRALEIALTIGGSSVVDRRKKGPPLVDALQIGVEHHREELYRRIHEAIDAMIKAGWLAEVEMLLREGVSENAPAMSSIGYRDLVKVCHGIERLEEVIPHIQQATRNYAKRQMTWFRRDPRIRWIQSEEQAFDLMKRWLS